VSTGDFCQESAALYFGELFRDGGLDVNIYSSNMDALLGPPTTEPGIAMGLESAQLSGAFYNTSKTRWKLSPASRQPVGYARCLPGAKTTGANARGAHHAIGANRFCYTIIRNAGHETAEYQSASAYDMTRRFISGEAFDDSSFDPMPPSCTAEQQGFDDAIAGYHINV